MYTVYVIKSINKNFTYCGFTLNLMDRLKRHNSGYEKSTKHYAPFKLIYKEVVSTRIEARQREIFLKSGVGRKFLEQFK